MSSPARRPVAARLTDFFPPGFNAKLGNYASISSFDSSHFSFLPSQLLNSLVGRGGPIAPIESIVVRSAWYGKQTKAAQHEFIVIRFDDIGAQGIFNYLVLDRNAGVARAGAMNAIQSSSESVKAKDQFRISYEGNMEKLLGECQLKPYRFLEELLFPLDTPLRLYELLTLASVASKRYPLYNVHDSSCYLYAGVIWECMRLMRPSATYDGTLATKRGKCRWLRYIPTSSAKQVTYEDAQREISQIELNLREPKNTSHSGRAGDNYEKWVHPVAVDPSDGRSQTFPSCGTQTNPSVIEPEVQKSGDILKLRKVEEGDERDA